MNVSRFVDMCMDIYCWQAWFLYCILMPIFSQLTYMPYLGLYYHFSCHFCSYSLVHFAMQCSVLVFCLVWFILCCAKYSSCFLPEFCVNCNLLVWAHKAKVASKYDWLWYECLRAYEPVPSNRNDKTDYQNCSRLYCPVQALGSTVPSIHLLISALYISFACLHRMVPHLSFFFTFFLAHLFLWEWTHCVFWPEVVRGDQTWAFCFSLFFCVSDACLFVFC